MDREHMRLLLAARLSKKANAKDEGLGIETQDKRGREWAERQGHTIVAVAADTRRGTIAPWDRPNLRPWVTRPDLMQKYDGILAYKNDRLSRGAWDDETRIRQWASDNGKVLVIVDGPQWPPRDDGDFWSWTAQAKQANAEWVEICERTQRAIDELIDRKKLVGRPPWGYESVGEKYDHGLTPTSDGRTFVPEIFQRVANGDSLMTLAKWLDSQGAKPSQAKSWSPKSVAKIIRTRTYTGTRLQGGRVPMSVPQLVDAKLWTQANDRLDHAPVGRRNPSNGRTALLTGALWCARCQAPMYRIHSHGGLHYRCAGHHPQRKGCGNMVKLEATDQAVINLLSEASEPWTELRLIKGETHDVELAEVKLAIRDLGSQELPDAEYDARLAELRAERDRLEALPSIPDEWIQTDTGQTVGQHWASLDWDGKRAMLIENVKVRANRAENAHYQTIRVESRLFKSDLEPWITFSDQPMNLPPGWWHPHDWHD